MVRAKPLFRLASRAAAELEAGPGRKGETGIQTRLSAVTNGETAMRRHEASGGKERTLRGNRHTA